MRNIDTCLPRHDKQCDRLFYPKKGLSIAMLISACVALPALAQTPTDDIKVGDQLTAAGIAMRGYSPVVLPLPPGKWEVMARSDENIPLINRLNEPLTPSPKVVLTLLNREVLGKVIAAVVTYSPEVVRIRWTNPPCVQPKAVFTDAAGTTPESLDYACARVWYPSQGFKRYIADAGSSGGAWDKKYLASLAAEKDAFPDASIWVAALANRDGGRLFEMTLMARSTLSGKVDDQFDQSIRSWVNTFDKALIASLNAQKADIPEFPSPPLP